MEALKEREDGSWASFEVGLMVSRQNGKGSCLEAIELAGLILFGERLIIHSAHEFRTAKEAMRRLEFLLMQSGIKYKANRSHGEESLEILEGDNAGARVMFQTRTKGGGLGMTGDRVILDEAMMISSEAIQALMPTLSSRPNPQILYTGSAVDQRIHANCEVFGGVRSRALNALKTGDHSRLCYLEWSAPDDLPHERMSEPRFWAMSNPGLGYRQTTEKIADEFRAFEGMDGMRAFGVQRLGVGDWPQFGDSRSEIPSEVWQRHRVDDVPTFVGETVLTVYRSPEGGPWSIAAAQRTEDARIHVEVGYTGNDTADAIMDKLLGTIAAWAPSAIVVGHGGASEILPELELAGINPIVPSITDEAQACGGLLNDCFIDENTLPVLSHFNQTSLNNAVSHAVKKDLPSGGFKWQCVNEATYADLMAATLARWALLKFTRAYRAPLIFEPPTEEELAAWLEEDSGLSFA